MNHRPTQTRVAYACANLNHGERRCTRAPLLFADGLSAEGYEGAELPDEQREESCEARSQGRAKPRCVCG